MRFRRHTISAFTALALALGSTACGGNTPKADPSPTPTPPTSSSAPAKPTWQSNYNAKQLSWYRDALKTWTTYQDRSKSIWAAGKATPAAMNLFKVYFVDPLFPYNTLEVAEQNHLKWLRKPTTLWTAPTMISDPKTTSQGINVTLEQCIDYSQAVQQVNGKTEHSVYHHPMQRTIHMQLLGKTWMVVSLKDLEDLRKGQKVERCSPQQP